MDSRRGLAVIALVLSLALLTQAHSGRSYSRACPNAEKIIRETLDKFDRSLPAGILRLHFHDCFVNGCDGSILLESNPDGSDIERNAPPNKGSARGFEMIEEAKRRLEEACPGVVSCADTLAIAARDSIVKMGGEYYKVPTGRYDGRFSSFELARTDLPAPFFNAQQLIDNFKKQGLSTEDMVVLSGSHTLGTSNCQFFSQGQFDRLYNFNRTGKPDPTLSASSLQHLRGLCPPGSSNKVSLDKGSEFRFDNSYYKNLIHRNGVLTSDQTLAQSWSTRSTVQSLAYSSHRFNSKFSGAMIKMGNIGWKTKSNGEIRKICSRVNSRLTSGSKSAALN